MAMDAEQGRPMDAWDGATDRELKQALSAPRHDAAGFGLNVLLVPGRDTCFYRIPERLFKQSRAPQIFWRHAVADSPICEVMPKEREADSTICREEKVGGSQGSWSNSVYTGDARTPQSALKVPAGAGAASRWQVLRASVDASRLGKAWIAGAVGSRHRTCFHHQLPSW